MPDRDILEVKGEVTGGFIVLHLYPCCPGCGRLGDGGVEWVDLIWRGGKPPPDTDFKWEVSTHRSGHCD